MNVSVPKELVLNLIKASLETKLSRIGGFGCAQALPEDKGIVDDTTKIVIYSKDNKKVAFLLCSFSKFSNLPIRNLEKSRLIKRSLGKTLGSIILEPIIFGVEQGIEYVVWPYCNPLKSGFFRRKIQLFHFKPIILKWLKNSTQKTLCDVSDKEALDSFIRPLQKLKAKKNICEEIKNEISWQIVSLETHKWIPYFVMAHNDLWMDNFLVADNKTKNKLQGLTIIDWAGANDKSFAFYDLIRLSMSVNLSRTMFSKELFDHCSMLNCNKRNSMGYLLASLAFLADNLDQFPEDRFVSLVNKCFYYLQDRL